MDIDDHKELETALAKSESRLRLAQSAAGIALWEWDVVSGRITVTPEYFALQGLPPDAAEPTFERWRDQLHPEDRDRMLAELEAVFAGRRPYDTEFRVVWPDGSIHWLVGRGQVVRDEQGHPLKMCGANLDVTARRIVEERLKQLERLETVGRLAGGVAHEANNQMMVVLASVEFLLRDGHLPDTARADVEHIGRAGARTAAITAQLLAFSRRQMLRPEFLDINAVLQAWQPMLSRTLGQDVLLRLDLSPIAEFVLTDRHQMEQVLLNLALNAQEAMPNGGACTVKTKRVRIAVDEPRDGVAIVAGEYVTLTMRDTGRGMEPQVLKRIFEPFFTTKGVGDGSGLGLSTVYGIVKQSEGYVFAESSPGQGTTIRILLPVAVYEPVHLRNDGTGTAKMEERR